MSWTTEQHAMLVKRWADGLSAAMIAAEINAQFGTIYTRCSVLGRAHRQGLSVRQSSASQVRVPKYRKNRIGVRQRPEPILREFLGITFAELGKRHCRYPRGNPAVYCGQRKMRGSSYCAWCHEVCHQPSRWRAAA